MSFDEKYQDAVMRLDKIIKNDHSPTNLKKYIERYKFEEERKDKIVKGQAEREQNRRKKYVNWNEIKRHELTVDQNKMAQLAQNEISIMNYKLREREIYNKLDELNKSKKRYDSYGNSRSYDKYAIKNLKAKEFSKIVNKVNTNKINEQKRKKHLVESANSITNLNNYNNQKKFILQNNKNEHNNLLKNKFNTINEKNLNNPQNKRKNYIPPLPKRSVNTNNYDVFNDNKYNIDKRKPLDVKPDYLQQSLKNSVITKKRNILMNKEIKYDNNEDFLKNINSLKYQAEKADEKAKMQEELIKVHHDEYKYNTEACEKLYNHLYDSISAKIAIMKQLQNEIE